MSFASDISKYAKKTKLSMDDAVVAINTQLTNDIIVGTPVDSGRARGNWYPSISKPSNEVNLEAEDKSGAGAISEAQNVAKGSSGTVFYLTNNLKYIKRLEYGWSNQAPSGFMRRAIKNMKSALKG